jgi:hypothetical protein
MKANRTIEQILSNAGIARLQEDHSPFTYIRDEGEWAVSMNGFYTRGELAWAARAADEANRLYAEFPAIAHKINRSEFFQILAAAAADVGLPAGGVKVLANGVTVFVARGSNGSVIAVYSDEICVGVHKADSTYVTVEDFIAKTDYADQFEV